MIIQAPFSFKIPRLYQWGKNFAPETDSRMLSMRGKVSRHCSVEAD